MPKYVYTIHTQKKLELKAVRDLGINKKGLEETIEKPITIDRSEKPVLIAIGSLTKTLSLCVVYRKIKETTRIITFWPAEKGRYERKILSRR